MTFKRFEINKKTFSDDVLRQTYKYQKIYGFDMSGGKHGTHNNEADAFKHTFMQAYASLSWLRLGAKVIGDYHEFVEGKNDPEKERNMDLWNNSIGREIADDIRKEYGVLKVQFMPIDKLCEMAAERTINKMKNGELITNPNDKRNYKNMMYDRLQDKDRLFY
ncbi:hypothetical protein IKQ21_09880 [bacterium]|nr:hypothetical protein [bacterium]